MTEATTEDTGATGEAGVITIEVTTEVIEAEEDIEVEAGDLITFQGGLMTGHMTSTTRTRSRAALLTNVMEETLGKRRLELCML